MSTVPIVNPSRSIPARANAAPADFWNDLSPGQRWLQALAVYAGAVAACLLVLTLVLQLWTADLRVPFLYGGDGLLFQALVKGVIEQGWYLHNARLGAPFGLDLHDFPLV